MSTLLRLVLALLAAFTALGASRAAPRPGDEKTAGWLDSGRKIAVYPSDPAALLSYRELFSNMTSASELRSLLCDGDTVWIGTEGGLFAFDTVADTVFPVEGPFFTSVRALSLDNSGSLWVGGEAGLSVRLKHSWIHFSRDDYPFFERITGFYRGDNRMWISTYGSGCAYLAADTLTVLNRADSLLDDRVMNVIESGGSEIWFGTASGLCRTDSFSWQSLRYGSRIPVGAVEDMILDEEGNLFLAVYRQGVCAYSLGRVRTYGERNGLPSDEIRAFSLDPTGRLWAAGRSGLSVFDGSGWTPFRIPEVSFGGHSFLSVTHDVEGNCYAGTDQGLLLIVARDYYREIEIPQSFPVSSVSQVEERAGSMWFVTGDRVYRWQDDITGIYPPDPWFRGALTGLVADRGGGLWMTTRFGILHYSGGAWEVFDRRLGLPTENFISVARGERGDLWFRTFGSGVLRLTTGGWAHFSRSNGLPSDHISGMLVDRSGAVWVLSGEGEVARFERGAWKDVELPYHGGSVKEAEPADSTFEYGGSIRILNRPSISDRAVGQTAGLCLGKDAYGNVLVCRRDGIFVDDGGRWRVIDPPGPVEAVTPSCIIGSTSGEIWLGTRESGLFVLGGSRWSHYSLSKGLGSDQILSLLEDSAGRIWIGTRYGGVAVYGGR